MTTTCLLDYFSALDDPRQSWKVCYSLEEVLLIVLCATMAGAEDFVQIERWGNRKLDFLRRFLMYSPGPHSMPCFGGISNHQGRYQASCRAGSRWLVVGQPAAGKRSWP